MGRWVRRSGFVGCEDPSGEVTPLSEKKKKEEEERKKTKLATKVNPERFPP